MPSDICVRRTSSRRAAASTLATQSNKENISTTKTRGHKRKQILPEPDNTSTPRKCSVQSKHTSNAHTQPTDKSIPDRSQRKVQNLPKKSANQVAEESVLVVTGSSLPVRPSPAMVQRIQSDIPNERQKSQAMASDGTKSISDRKNGTNAYTTQNCESPIEDDSTNSDLVEVVRITSPNVSANIVSSNEERLETEGKVAIATVGPLNVPLSPGEPKKLTKKQQAAKRKAEAERCFEKQRALFSEIDKHELHYG